MIKGHSRAMATPQGEIGINTPTHSSLQLIYSQGFLLAEPNRKWEGEEVNWYSSHHSGLGHTAGREMCRVNMEGQMEGPCTTTMTSFVTDIATLPLCPCESSQAASCKWISHLSRRQFPLFLLSPLPHDSGALCVPPPASMQVG